MDAASPTSLSFTIPGGSAFTLDLANMTQVAADFQFTRPTVDGNAPSSIEKVEVDTDGTMYAIYTDGTRLAKYRIPLATVPSPDNLSRKRATSIRSGSTPETSRSALPGKAVSAPSSRKRSRHRTSTLRAELTSMIELQRGYTANSKVFQTGADLLDVLVNLKR